MTSERRAALRARYSPLSSVVARDVLECLDALDALVQEAPTNPRGRPTPAPGHFAAVREILDDAKKDPAT